MNESQNIQSRNSCMKKVTTGKRTRQPLPPTSTPNQLPKLIKKPEPIPVTFDQFQAVEK